MKIFKSALLIASVFVGSSLLVGCGNGSNSPTMSSTGVAAENGNSGLGQADIKAAESDKVSNQSIDEQFVSGADHYEIKGQWSKSSDSTSNGSVIVNGNVELIRNGSDLGSFALSSNDLQLADCGFAGGSLEFVNNLVSQTLTVSDCQN